MSDPTAVEIAVLRYLDMLDSRGSTHHVRTSEIQKYLADKVATPASLYSVMEGMFKRGWVEAYENTEESGLFRISAKGQFQLQRVPSQPPVVQIRRSPVVQKTVPKDVQLVTDRMHSAMSKLDGLGLTNVEASQAKAYLAAALSIAEAPTPRWDIIKEILTVISVIAAISGMITGILALL